MGFIVGLSLLGFALFVLVQAAVLRTVVRAVVANPTRATFGRALAVSLGLCAVGLGYGAVVGLITAKTGPLSTAGVVLALGLGVALRLFVTAKSFALRVADVIMVEVVLWLGSALAGASVALFLSAPYLVGGALALAAAVWGFARLEKRRDAEFFREVSAALDRKITRT
jgi:hypothetical protein